jgi:hypothetical protein
MDRPRRTRMGHAEPVSVINWDQAPGSMSAMYAAPFEGDLVSAPAPNVAAVVTLPAEDGYIPVVSGIAWSYNGEPTAGRLTLGVGAATVFDIDITSGGPGFIPFAPPRAAQEGETIVLTLAAGGAGISGKVTVLGFWTR